MKSINFNCLSVSTPVTTFRSKCHDMHVFKKCVKKKISKLKPAKKIKQITNYSPKTLRPIKPVLFQKQKTEKANNILFPVNVFFLLLFNSLVTIVVCVCCVYVYLCVLFGITVPPKIMRTTTTRPWPPMVGH
jgi:hypothetical protein